MTHRVVTGRGRIKWVEQNGRTEFNDNGNRLISLGTIYDITVQKEAGEKLKDAMVEIKKANLAKSIFLSNMSHELRTPLNAIIGYAQLFAEDQTLSGQHQSGIKTIREAGEHLLMLINEILDLSKIEAGKLELFAHEIVFKKFLQGLCDIVRNRCSQKKILFRYEPDNHLPDIIVADELRLRQILLNLLSNAAKFTDSGYCLFRVKAQCLAGERTRLTFIVEDSGPGIAENQQKEVFEPFKQSGERLKYSEGTGLGLSISLQLATLMQGELSLISPIHGNNVDGYGPGSRFIFTAVVVYRDLKASEKYFEPEARYELEPFEPGTKTILIVDDQPTNRAVLKDTLEPLGFAIIEAPDGKDVVNACEKQLPDLIFMDLVMPGDDGFTTLKQLLKTDRYARIPVVAITASLINQTNLREKCQNVGFKAFLPKPFATQDLLKILADLLDLNLHQNMPKAPVEEDIVPPPLEIIEQLRNHLADGNIDAIESMASDIGDMDSGRYHAFAERLGRLAADIQLKGIEQLIDQFFKK
jgi:signal transduction histidine kinase/DNA-binding NarL/FixJ family response regulator